MKKNTQKKGSTVMAFVQAPASPTELAAVSFRITPEIAAEWLKKNPNNRAVRPAHVTKLAELMRKDQYVPVLAEPIAFDKKGNLSNGQHRLRAIIISGVSYVHPVVYGLDFDIFARSMPVASRSRLDALTAYGVKNADLAAKMLPYVHGVHMGTTHDFHSGAQRISADEAMDIYGYYPGLQESIEATRALRSDVAFPTLQHVFASAHYLFKQVDAEKTNEYLAGVLHGENLTMGAPALAVRNRLNRDLQAKALRKKLGPMVLASLIVGWNAFAAGKRLTIMKMPAEFPRIYGFDL